MSGSTGLYFLGVSGCVDIWWNTMLTGDGLYGCCTMDEALSLFFWSAIECSRSGCLSIFLVSVVRSA